MAMGKSLDSRVWRSWPSQTTERLAGSQTSGLRFRTLSNLFACNGQVFLPLLKNCNTEAISEPLAIRKKIDKRTDIEQIDGAVLVNVCFWFKHATNQRVNERCNV